MAPIAKPKIRWGILGPGSIAKAFAGGLAHSRFGELVALGTRDPRRAGLAQDFPGARIHAGYDALLGDGEVDAVYIATPHPFHAQWAIKAARAGKHALVEKPLGLSAFEADAMMHEARKAGTFLGEAFMYRHHPQTRKLIALIGEGAIGDVRMIKSSFGFALPKFMPEHRLYANDLAGGGILDVGGYPVSMARLIAGAAQGKAFADPIKISGAAHLGRSGVDEWASALLQFPGDIIAEVSCSVSLAQDNMLRILGSKGRIEIADFWFASGREGGQSTIEIIDRKGARSQVHIRESRWLYSFEADDVAKAIRDGKQEFSAPGASWADSLGTLRVLDQWRKDAGLEYEIEKPARRSATISGAPLAKLGQTVPKRAIAGLGKPASLIALGFEDFRSFASGAIMLDAFWEAGGNIFDTAFVYASGYTERLLGEWLASRGVRDEAVIIVKGAHTPNCAPEKISAQLTASLERLQTDHADIYFMHRDNIEVPVGEFVDAMDAEVKAGRIRGLYGVSNWTRKRLKQAIAWAEKHHRQPPGALSNNFALAEMLDPIWEGCVSASSDKWKAWLTKSQLPNFAWSSQARGFFTDRAGRTKRDDAELVRVWYSASNFKRRERAIALAKEFGADPVQIALAYVLAQPFASIPIIGPRRLDELENSIAALKLNLSEQQRDWLETGAPA